MGEIRAKRDTATTCWAILRLENGDQIWISVAQASVKICKMKWRNLVPGSTLWASKSLVEVGEKFFLDDRDPSKRPLDLIIDKLIDCGSAAEVCTRLTTRS